VTGFAARMLSAVLLSALAAAGPATAHPRATSLSAWEMEEGPAGPVARVTVRVPWSALQKVLPEVAGVVPESVGYRGDVAAVVDAYLLEHVRLSTDATPCALRGVVLPVTSSDPTHFARRFRLACEPGTPTISVDLFQEGDPAHLHLARARLPDGRELDRVIVLGQSEWTPGGAPAAGEGASSLEDYLRLGIGHIASGADHLMFVLALLLTGTGVGQLATVVTGFTVAHSATLALGVLGWVTPLPAAVEALIGLSIVVVACENFALTLGPAAGRVLHAALAGFIGFAALAAAAGRLALPATALLGVGLFSLCYLGLSARVGRVGTLRWLVALVFGLVHGFGFAGVLAETGLPRENVLPALLGFNLGVEVGQLVAVAIGWLALRSWLLGPAPRRLATIQWGSTPVLAAGVYWFLSRAFAP